MKKRIEAAISAVSLACRVTRQAQQRAGAVRKMTKDDRSPVTVADFASQAVVAIHLAHRFSAPLGTLRIVGEENAGALRETEQAPIRHSVVEAVREAEPDVTEQEILDAIDACGHDASAASYWTLDPVDGTKGFLRGEQYAVSLAWIEGGRVRLGVMGCPNLSADFSRDFSDPDPHGVIFIAVEGEGATWAPVAAATRRARDDGVNLDGASSHPVRSPQRLAVRELPDRPRDLRELIRVCESVESAHTKHGDTARIVEYLGGAGASARLDSQAKYAVVARGQADAYLRMPTRPGYTEKIWDHAAGSLVATEAGAIVTDIHDRPLDFSCGARLERNRGVVCATPHFHGRIIEAIRELRIAQLGVRG